MRMIPGLLKNGMCWGYLYYFLQLYLVEVHFRKLTSLVSQTGYDAFFFVCP